MNFNQKENLEPPWNKTSEFLGNLVELIRNHYVTVEYLKVDYVGHNYVFQKGNPTNKTSSVSPGPGRNTRPFVSFKHHKRNIDGYDIVVTHKKEEDFTTRLWPSSFRLVSLRYGMINGQTPMISTTTSTRCGMVKSFVRMALLRPGRDDFQSRVTAPFS